MQGTNTAHPLVSVTVPAGQTWDVRIEGRVTATPPYPDGYPHFRIGSSNSPGYAQGATVDFSGTITSTSRTIAMVTNVGFPEATFVGTVTIEK